MTGAALPHTLRGDLRRALVAAFDDSGLKMFADEELGLNLKELGGDDLPDRAYELVRHIEESGRMHDLLDAAERVSDNATLRAAVENARQALLTPVPGAAGEVAEDPYQTCFVHGNRAFIDRAELRDALRRLAKPKPDAAALKVTGDPRTGKSYSFRLIEYIVQQEGGRFALIDLREQGATFKPDALVRSVLRQIGRNSRTESIPPYEPPAARWIVELREFLAGEIQDMEQRCWIVVDGVYEDVVSSETLDLIKGLVTIADQYHVPMRVVLLDCPEQMPPDIEPYIEKENLTTLDAARARVLLGQFFTDWARYEQRRLTEEHIAVLVDKTMSLVPDGPEFLARLGLSVREVTKALSL